MKTVLLLAILFAIATAVLFWSVLHDDELFPDNDLWLGQRQRVADAKNALTYLSEVSAKIEADWEALESVFVPYEPDPDDEWDDEARTGSPDVDEQAELVAAFKSLGNAFDLIERALACEQYVAPQADFLDRRGWHRMYILNATRILSVRARWSMFQGDLDSAAFDARSLLRLARICGEQPVSLYHLRAADLAAIQGRERLLAAAAHHQATADQVREWLHVHHSLELPMQESFRKAILANYAMHVRFVERMERREVHLEDLYQDMPEDPPRFFSRCTLVNFKPNRTRNALAARTRALIAAYGHQPAQIEALLGIDRSYLGEEPSTFSLLASGNGVGRIFVQGTSDGRTLLRMLGKSEMQSRATTLLLALRLHELEQGQLPDRLVELLPGYLSEIPKDSFDGQPLRYSKADRWVYSIGEDLKDEGGGKVSGDPTWTLEDPARVSERKEGE